MDCFVDVSALALALAVKVAWHSLTSLVIIWCAETNLLSIVPQVCGCGLLVVRD
jgi:hypothetical protein